MPKLLGLFVFLALSSFAQQANWTGPYRPCTNSDELRKTGHMTIGVRYDISDPAVISQFHRAFDFWGQLLDADFYDEPSTSCAIAVVNGTRAVLTKRNVVARAQLPDRPNFNGWIAVDPFANSYLVYGEAIAVWIHEIGHLLGLKHNQSAESVMYFIDADAYSRLDATDVHALSLLHALRPASMTP